MSKLQLLLAFFRRSSSKYGRTDEFEVVNGGSILEVSEGRYGEVLYHSLSKDKKEEQVGTGNKGKLACDILRTRFQPTGM